MSKVILHRHAARYLKRLPKETRERIKETLKEFENHPLEYSGVKKMFGEWAGYYRMRVGKLRIIFWFDENEDVVYVDYIGARGDIYK
jgi:mRNA interferase RelE/StbE